MPKTKLERIFFTAVTAFFMVYGMTIYNTVLANGTFTNRTLLDALTHMWVEYGIIFLLAFFVAGAIAPKLAFRVVQPGDRPICIIFVIQTFTVILMVAFASVIGLFHAHGFSANVIPN